MAFVVSLEASDPNQYSSIPGFSQLERRGTTGLVFSVEAPSEGGLYWEVFEAVEHLRDITLIGVIPTYDSPLHYFPDLYSLKTVRELIRYYSLFVSMSDYYEEHKNRIYESCIWHREISAGRLQSYLPKYGAPMDIYHELTLYPRLPHSVIRAMAHFCYLAHATCTTDKLTAWLRRRA